MGDIEDGMAKMRQYWANQRERLKQPIKVNIPNPQENVANPVYLPPQPIYNQPQPIPYQQPVQTQLVQPVRRETVRFNYPTFGFSMLLVGITIIYLAYTESTFAVMLKPMFAQPLMILLAVVFFIGCIAMMCVSDRK